MRVSCVCPCVLAALPSQLCGPSSCLQNQGAHCQCLKQLQGSDYHCKQALTIGTNEMASSLGGGLETGASQLVPRAALCCRSLLVFPGISAQSPLPRAELRLPAKGVGGMQWVRPGPAARAVQRLPRSWRPAGSRRSMQCKQTSPWEARPGPRRTCSAAAVSGVQAAGVSRSAVYSHLRAWRSGAGQGELSNQQAALCVCLGSSSLCPHALTGWAQPRVPGAPSCRTAA